MHTKKSHLSCLAMVVAGFTMSNTVYADTLTEQQTLKTQLSSTLSVSKLPSENFNLWSFMILL